MRRLAGLTLAALMWASAPQAATVAGATVWTSVGLTVQQGDPNDLDVWVTPFEMISLIDLAGPVSVPTSIAAADDIDLGTDVDLAASAGVRGGLINLVGFADLSLGLANTGNAPIEVLFLVEYVLSGMAAVDRPLTDTALAFSSIDVSSSLVSIAFFESIDTLLSGTPPALSGFFEARVLVPAGGETVTIDVLTEAQILIDAVPIPLPSAGFLLLAAIGGLAGLRSMSRQVGDRGA